ncbi:Hsp90 co-chaperone Cdc37 [Yarrowia sp. C11]|nr:Hsp90 co-chaperone Cdc37 [Yarrowia sp. C11]KAG5370747.1 Hsp90 co-chaperone Cdc37 [Yarrowia sp. E02]
MVLDYSKWDKIELSDDSDVEVHPNVDKKSFIRWKQRDIHEKRDRNKMEIASLELTMKIDVELVERLDKLLTLPQSELAKESIEELLVKSKEGLKAKDTPTAPNPQKEGEQMNCDDMLESLLDMIKPDVDTDNGASFYDKLKEHRDKLVDHDKSHRDRLAELYDEKAKYITSEDVHDVYNSTVLNKTVEPEAGEDDLAELEKPKKTETTMETLNSPGGSSGAPVESTLAKATEDTDDDYSDPSPAARRFAQIPADDLKECYRFVSKHPEICTEKEKDALVMEGFQLQLAGKTADMERTVHNAILLQYCAQLGPNGYRNFFERILQPSGHPALEVLKKDVAFTINHVKTRCEILKKESEEENEQIQLHAVDPNTEIVVNQPPAEDAEAMKVFHELSPEMQKAVESGKLEEINKVLANYSVEDAEKVLRMFDECGILAVEEKIYDATEWQKQNKDKEVRDNVDQIVHKEE